MATLNIFWYRAGPVGDAGGTLPLVTEPEISRESVTTSSTAATSEAAPEGAKVAILDSDTLHYFRVNGTADTSCRRQQANEETFINVKEGDTISVRTA